MEQTACPTPKRKVGRPRRPIDLYDAAEDPSSTVDPADLTTITSKSRHVDQLQCALRLMISVGPVSAAPGIYFLLDANGVVVYVGQSKNVALRMRGHSGKEFTEIRMLRVDNEYQRDKLEILFIALFRPKYNVTYN